MRQPGELHVVLARGQPGHVEIHGESRPEPGAERAVMDGQSIIHGIRHESDPDEAPSAYKPIMDVMKNQADLVKPVVELRPIAVIKG